MISAYCARIAYRAYKRYPHSNLATETHSKLLLGNFYNLSFKLYEYFGSLIIFVSSKKVFVGRIE